MVVQYETATLDLKGKMSLFFQKRLKSFLAWEIYIDCDLKAAGPNFGAFYE